MQTLVGSVASAEIGKERFLVKHFLATAMISIVWTTMNLTIFYEIITPKEHNWLYLIGTFSTYIHDLDLVKSLHKKIPYNH